MYSMGHSIPEFCEVPVSLLVAGFQIGNVLLQHPPLSPPLWSRDTPSIPQDLSSLQLIFGSQFTEELP